MLGHLPYEIIDEIVDNLSQNGSSQLQLVSKFIRTISEKYAYRNNYNLNQIYLSQCHERLDSDSLILKKKHLFKEFKFESLDQLYTLSFLNLKKVIVKCKNKEGTAVTKPIELKGTVLSLHLTNVPNSTELTTLLKICLTNLIELSIQSEYSPSLLKTNTTFVNLTSLELIVKKLVFYQLTLISKEFPNLKKLRLDCEILISITSSLPIFTNLLDLELQVNSELLELIFLSKFAFPSIKTASLNTYRFTKISNHPDYKPIFDNLLNWPELHIATFFNIPLKQVTTPCFEHITDLTLSNSNETKLSQKFFQLIFQTLTKFTFIGRVEDVWFQDLNQLTKLRSLKFENLFDIEFNLTKWLITCQPLLQSLSLHFMQFIRKAARFYKLLDPYQTNLNSLITVELCCHNEIQQLLYWLKARVQPTVHFRLNEENDDWTPVLFVTGYKKVDKIIE